MEIDRKDFLKIMGGGLLGLSVNSFIPNNVKAQQPETKIQKEDIPIHAIDHYLNLHSGSLSVEHIDHAILSLDDKECQLCKLFDEWIKFKKTKNEEAIQKWLDGERE